MRPRCRVQTDPFARCRLLCVTPRRDFRLRMARPADVLVMAPLALDALSAAMATRAGFDATVAHRFGATRAFMIEDLDGLAIELVAARP